MLLQSWRGNCALEHTLVYLLIISTISSGLSQKRPLCDYRWGDGVFLNSQHSHSVYFWEKIVSLRTNIYLWVEILCMHLLLILTVGTNKINKGSVLCVQVNSENSE